MHEDEQSDGESLAAAVVGYWRLAIVTRAMVYGGLVLAYAGLMSVAGRELWIPLGIGTGVVIVGVAFAALLPRRRYERFRFRLQRRRLWIRDGVFFHREKSIPLSRIQHVDVSRGPLERIFGLARVTVYTAGGRLATARVLGLLPERADRLRLRLLGATESLDGATP